MATQLQIRRGTSTQVAAFTGAEGEIVVNTTNDSVHVNDGSTAGGFEMARADLNNVSDTDLNAALTGNTVSALTITTLTLGATAITATGAELNFVDGVTSAIQTQIDTKAPLASPTFTGTVSADGLTVDGNVSVVSALPRIILEENDATDLNTAIRNNGGVFKIQTVNDAANSFTNRMDINHSSGNVILYGDVGIGATSATARLEVTGAFGYASGANSLGTTVSKAAARIRGSSDASTSLFFGSLTNDAEQYIQSSNGAGSAADDLALNPYGGNVGIGTNSPNALLHVGGTAETQGSQANPAIQIGSTSGYRLGMYTDAEGGYIENKNGDNGLIFRVKTAGEAMRIDGGTGNLLVGTTSTTLYDATSGGGIMLDPNGPTTIARDDQTALYVNRTSTHGDMVQFRKDGVTHGRLSNTGTYFFIAGGAAGGTHSGIRFINNSSQRPCTSGGGNLDNTVTFGASNARWELVYSVGGTTSTSDRNEKQDIEELTDAEQRVAVAAKGLLRKYRWKSAVAEKGDDARIHFGIIAQDLQDAFAAEGLDAARYGMWCSDTFWVDSEGETYDTQEEAPQGATEKTRLGVRYAQLLAFIIAAI